MPERVNAQVRDAKGAQDGGGGDGVSRGRGDAPLHQHGAEGRNGLVGAGAVLHPTQRASRERDGGSHGLLAIGRGFEAGEAGVGGPLEAADDGRGELGDCGSVEVCHGTMNSVVW